MKLILLILSLLLVSDRLIAQGAADIYTTNNPERYNDSLAKQEIEKIYSMLLSGNKFETLAEKYSQDPSNFNDGGKIDWCSYEILDTDFQKIILGLKLNESSKPFKTQFGYHIAQLLDKKGKEVLTRHILIRIWD